jgi:hypothetical protein
LEIEAEGEKLGSWNRANGEGEIVERKFERKILYREE